MIAYQIIQRNLHLQERLTAIPKTILLPLTYPLSALILISPLILLTPLQPNLHTPHQTNNQISPTTSYVISHIILLYQKSYIHNLLLNKKMSKTKLHPNLLISHILRLPTPHQTLMIVKMTLQLIPCLPLHYHHCLLLPTHPHSIPIYPNLTQIQNVQTIPMRILSSLLKIISLYILHPHYLHL